MSKPGDVLAGPDGDGDCLHCELAAVIDRHLKTRGGNLPHAMQIANALAELIGDLVAPAPEKARETCLGSLARLMRIKCAQTVRAGASAAVGTPPHKLN